MRHDWLLNLIPDTFPYRVQRDTHFVCEHLEGISRRALEKYQEIVRQYVRRRRGVYALYARGKLYYVGLTSNLRSRLQSHLKDKHGESWDRFSVYLTRNDTHIRELEALVLRIVKPKGNSQKGKFSRSLDIRRRFARDIRLCQRDELRWLLGKVSKVAPAPTTEIVSLGREPGLAPYVDKPLKLHVRFKGKLLHAHVRKDGRIRFASKIYDSPSLAGAAACQRKTCNGWKFWLYERAPGDWVPLDELRR